MKLVRAWRTVLLIAGLVLTSTGSWFVPFPGDRLMFSLLAIGFAYWLGYDAAREGTT